MLFLMWQSLVMKSTVIVSGLKLLSVFEEISLKSTLDCVKEKHNLKTAKKVSETLITPYFIILIIIKITNL